MPSPTLRLRELRDAAGLTQVELAEKLGVSQKTVSRLESGTKPRADLDQLAAICRVLKCTMSDLVPITKRRSR